MAHDYIWMFPICQSLFYLISTLHGSFNPHKNLEESCYSTLQKMRLTHRRVALVAQGYPAKKKQSWDVKPAVWWQPSRYLGGGQPEPQIQQPSLRLLSPCLGSHCYLLAELSTAPCWTFSYVNQGPRILSTAACTQVVNPDASFFPGLAGHGDRWVFRDIATEWSPWTS